MSKNQSASSAICHPPANSGESPGNLPQPAAAVAATENIAEAVQFGRILNRSLFFASQFLITRRTEAADRAEEEWAALQSQVRRLSETAVAAEQLTDAVGACRRGMWVAFDSSSAKKRRENLAEELYRLSVHEGGANEIDLAYERYVEPIDQLRCQLFSAAEIVSERMQRGVYLGAELDAWIRPRQVWQVLEEAERRRNSELIQARKEGSPVSFAEAFPNPGPGWKPLTLIEAELPDAFVDSASQPSVAANQPLLQERLRELDIDWQFFQTAIANAEHVASATSPDQCLDFFVDRLRENLNGRARRKDDEGYLGLHLDGRFLCDATGGRARIKGLQRLNLLSALLKAGRKGITRREAWQLLSGDRVLDESIVDKTKANLEDDIKGLNLEIELKNSVLVLQRWTSKAPAKKA